MGQYNPHAPYIIGQEWVPIRNAYYVPDGVVERGYTFTIDAVTTPVSGAFYVEEQPENRLANACDFISVYPSGREMLSGPVKRVRISASAVAVNNPGSIDITEGVAALLNPEDPSTIIFDADSGISSQLRVSFDTNAYAEILLGKRILDVRVRYQMFSNNVGNAENMSIDISDTSTSRVHFPQVTEITAVADLARISTLSITEMDPFWDSTAVARAQRTILPWRFQELNRFRSGASPALVVQIQNNATEFDVFLGFLQLEVIYCEETRVLYGGFKTYDSGISNTPTLLAEFYNVGAIATRLYSPTTHTQGATLPAGEYVVTMYHRDMASRSVFQGAPRLHALREYYQLPHQRGVHVHQTTVLDDEFARTDTDVLTQITLHTATQIVTGSHPYGTQYGAPVYGVRTAVQRIENDPANGGPYAQVRFYARRYGSTTVPLSIQTTGGSNTVSISVGDFDALPEIVDGWREVTLRFNTPVAISPTAGTVDWRWLATGELAGNQWQVMVADGPSGAWQPNPTAASTGPATYWAPLGSVVNLTWQTPSVSGVADDATSDAVLILSTDPPSVTGFALEVLEQELDVAVGCDATPRCAPTGLDYVHLSWDYATICDTFRTDVASGWGTPQVGPAWSASLNNTTISVADGVAKVVHNATSSSVIMTSAVSVADVDVTVTDMTWPVVPIGANPVQIVRARFQDSSNYVQIEIYRGTVNDVSYRLVSRLAGVDTTTGFVGLPFTALTTLSVRLRAVGTSLQVKIWPSHMAQPQLWTATLTATFLGAGAVMFIQDISSVTNAFPVTTTIGSFTAVTSAAMYDTYLELQRSDTVDAEWKTIMLSSGPCVDRFDDYEARVGVVSSYRIRTLNALDFAGPWVTGSATVPSPGVTTAGSANSVLIFTSNEQPSSNLAYVMQFEGQPVETFSFPEADTVSLQRLFGRDFFLAVRPLERGGERFSRVLLVNQAAIPVPSLANFRGLRDLAWADLSYVCVRDELGNRWFATVIVPDGSVRGDRTIYMARIDVAEVTNTPSQVDP